METGLRTNNAMMVHVINVFRGDPRHEMNEALHPLMCTSKGVLTNMKHAMNTMSGLVIELQSSPFGSDLLDRYPKGLPINGLVLEMDSKRPAGGDVDASLSQRLLETLKPLDLSMVRWIRTGTDTVRSCIKVFVNDIATLAASCPSLKHVVFQQGTKLMPFALFSCRLFQCLETISVEVTGDEDERVVEELANMSKLFPHLEVTLIWNVANINLEHVMVAAARVEKLRGLELECMDDDWDSHAVAAAMSSSSFHELVDLSLFVPGSCGSDDVQAIAGPLLHSLMALVKLKSLCLPENVTMSGTELATLVAAMPCLTHVELGGLTWNGKDKPSTWPVGSMLELLLWHDKGDIGPLLLLPLEHVSNIYMRHRDVIVHYSIPCSMLARINTLFEKLEVDFDFDDMQLVVHIQSGAAVGDELVHNVQRKLEGFFQKHNQKGLSIAWAH